jgi:hypothetical protein
VARSLEQLIEEATASLRLPALASMMPGKVPVPDESLIADAAISFGDRLVVPT